MKCSDNYYIESVLGILFVSSELLSKSGCKINSVSEGFHAFWKYWNAYFEFKAKQDIGMIGGGDGSGIS